MVTDCKGTRDQTTNLRILMQKAREHQNSFLSVDGISGIEKRERTAKRRSRDPQRMLEGRRIKHSNDISSILIAQVG